MKHQGRCTMEEHKDNDAIYKKLKQVIKDDGSIEINVNGPEARLIANLGALTQQKFLEQIEPFMTLQRAQFVRGLRVDEDQTWRGIATGWEKEFESVARWDFRGNQLAGMALCELAAKMFAEDSMQPPWN